MQTGGKINLINKITVNTVDCEVHKPQFHLIFLLIILADTCTHTCAKVIPCSTHHTEHLIIGQFGNCGSLHLQ